MRRVLTLRTQDPALPRYQDYLVFSTLTCTHIMIEPLGLELHYIPICFGTIFLHQPIPLHLKWSKQKNYELKIFNQY